MVTEQDLKNLDTDGQLWTELAHIQCAKHPDVMARTVELLEEEDQKGQANILSGQ